MYNAQKDHVIIIIIWLGTHCDISTVLCNCGQVTAHLVQTHQMAGC